MTMIYSAEHDLAAAARALCAGELALVPTETVYGVGVCVSAYADADEIPGEDTGYGRIFTLKRRETSQTVPWLVSGAADIDRYGVDAPRELRLLAERFWPGALTIVVDAAPSVPAFMRAADGTVALRASASPAVRELIRLTGSPLAVTSANTHGEPAPSAFADIEARILDGVDLAIDAGETVCRDASTIVAARDGVVEVLREGAIPRDLIMEALRG